VLTQQAIIRSPNTVRHYQTPFTINHIPTNKCRSGLKIKSSGDGCSLPWRRRRRSRCCKDKSRWSGSRPMARSIGRGIQVAVRGFRAGEQRRCQCAGCSGRYKMMMRMVCSLRPIKPKMNLQYAGFRLLFRLAEYSCVATI
jgi:hypothetical protein